MDAGIIDVDTMMVSSLHLVLHDIIPGDEYLLRVPNVPGVSMDQQMNGSSRIITYSGEEEISVYIDLLSVRYFSSLDEPEPGTRLVSIQVFTPSDSTGSSLASNVAQARIEVRAVNDNPPQFSRDSYNGSVTENARAGTVVGVDIGVIDADIHGATAITFNIEGDSPDFAIEPISGVITTLRPLNADLSSDRVIMVIASDNDGQAGLTSSVEVTIRVLDVNDNPPMFNQRTYVQLVFENTLSGTSVLTVSAEDLDVTAANSEISFQIRVADLLAPGSGMGSMTTLVPVDFSILFEINSVSGVISIVSVLDFELDNEYNFYVLAIDSGIPSLTGTAMVTITLQDVNDNAPQFDVDEYRISIAENTTPPYQALTVSATDADSGQFGQVEFSLQGTQFFMIDRVTGVLSLVEYLDYEVDTSHSFTVVVSDLGVPPLLSSVPVTIEVINVNDNSPQFVPDSYEFSIFENSDFEAQLTAVDLDGSEPNFSFSVSDEGQYTFSSQTDELEINPSTGLIRNRPGFVFDFETQMVHTFIVAANDGLFTSLANMTVRVLDQNDNPPVFVPPSYAMSISEFLPVGTSVLQVRAQDVDSGINADLFYSIISGNTDSTFDIDPSSGIISTAIVLDFETVSSTTFMLVVAATNTELPNFNTSATVTLTLTDINDVAPVLSIDNANVTFIESSGPLMFALGIRLTDADTQAHPVTQCSAVLTRGPCDSTEIAVCPEAISVDVSLLESPGLEISIMDDMDQLTLLIYGNATDMDYQAVLSTLEYSNLVLEPVPGPRYVEIVCEDSDLQSNLLQLSIDVEFVNEFCSVIAASQTAFNYVEDSGPLQLGQLAGFSATDRDRPPHDRVMTVEIVLSNRLDGDFESISDPDLPGGSGEIGAIGSTDPQTITFTDITNLNMLVQRLQSIVYTNNRLEPTLGERLITIRPIDTLPDCEPLVISISISPVNDNPPDLVVMLSNAVQYVEGGDPLEFASLAGLVVVDLDHNALFLMESSQVVLNGVLDTDMELLSYNESLLQTGITVSEGT